MSQDLKPATAAKKLGILLQATPPEFQEGTITRDELHILQTEPPQWLIELRENGPHPKDIVAHKLGISISGLARHGQVEPLTTAEIQEMLENKPKWLHEERARHAFVMDDQARIKDQRKAKIAKRNESA
ncbi:DUF5997 family protein [Humidisolicoccus flavus]|uniref:DUF5997 family protein n=1 Tax=Humidisolicoccus flavus TaxID=3111414 RepID=UPI003D2FD0BA